MQSEQQLQDHHQSRRRHCLGRYFVNQGGVVDRFGLWERRVGVECCMPLFYILTISASSKIRGRKITRSVKRKKIAVWGVASLGLHMQLTLLSADRPWRRHHPQSPTRRRKVWWLHLPGLRRHISGPK